MARSRVKYGTGFLPVLKEEVAACGGKAVEAAGLSVIALAVAWMRGLVTRARSAAPRKAVA